jgi:signal transduction histidine kinase
LSKQNLKNSTKFIGFICLYLLTTVNGLAQSTMLVNKIPKLSQNTNFYLMNTPDHQLCISSTDGLNVFDGLNDRIYQPASANMFGQNIQSPFFRDQSGLVWFTTYEALICFDPVQDTMAFVFMKEANGPELKENYVAFKLIDDLLYLKAGNKFFVYNISTRKIDQQYRISLQDYYQFVVEERNGKKYFFAGGLKDFSLYELNGNHNFELIDKGNFGISSCIVKNNFIWIGGSKGTLYQYDLDQHKMINTFRIGDAQISGIIPFSDSTLLLANYGGSLVTFSTNQYRIEESFLLMPLGDCEPVTALVRPYIDQDSTLWTGSDGQGVYYYNLTKRKFKTWLQGINVTKLIPYKGDTIIVLTRRSGILLIDGKGQVIRQWPRLPNQAEIFSVKTGILMDQDNLVFTNHDHVYLLNIPQNVIRILNVSGYNGRLYAEQIDRLSNGKIVAALDGNSLYEVTLNNQTLQFAPYFPGHPDAKQILNFKQDDQANLYLSNDDANIIVFKADDVTKTHVYDATIPLSGGVLSIADKPNSDEIYLTNSKGIFLINKMTKSFTQVIDKDSFFQTTIYTAELDAENKIWLSTNKGLMEYDPATNKAHVFSKMDGVQEWEYNSNASLVTGDGHMYFGGINGLNYFHPGEVKLSQRRAPVYVSELKINDKPDARYRVAQYVFDVDLPYWKNTISLKFHSIDNADPDAARVKYILKGADADTLISEGPEAIVRYLNLRPGDYVLSMVGVNSDGVANAEPKEIHISIRPPFWMTWWFITLAFLALIGFIYWIIRGYYQRKLDRKNQLLREQTLIIEKQQAVEHERTRIASEMHDDLGSGLTTIRYLSDKALRQAKDEEEITQIKTIADKSNDLVRNMSEIIWAMNSRFDNTENLIAYLRRYASEYLDQHQISVEFIIHETEGGTRQIGGEKRRNIFLVVKELLHNTVKYSNAKAVRIKMEWIDEFSIFISEIGGIGFDPEPAREKGNGLYNCQRRMGVIGGSITFERKPEAMEIQIQVPL